MRKGLPFVVGIVVLTLYAGAQDKTVDLHVSHVKSEYVGDKPTDRDCKKMPCTTLIITVEGHTAQTEFKLECKQWVLVADPIVTGKCWSLEAGGDYPVRRSGRYLLFKGDTEDTNPLYTITEEEERKTSSSKAR